MLTDKERIAIVIAVSVVTLLALYKMKKKKKSMMPVTPAKPKSTFNMYNDYTSGTLHDDSGPLRSSANDQTIGEIAGSRVGAVVAPKIPVTVNAIQGPLPMGNLNMYAPPLSVGNARNAFARAEDPTPY